MEKRSCKLEGRIMKAQFESSVKVIPCGQELVFQKMTDLRNLEKVKERIPADKIQRFECTEDSVTVSVSPVGDLVLQIIERDEPKCIKFETTKSPVPMNLWIQLLPVTDVECKMKLIVRAEVNMFMKGIISKPLKEGIEKMADVLAIIPYNMI